MSWFLDKVSRGTVGTAKGVYKYGYGNSKLAAGMGVLGGMYHVQNAADTWDDSDSKLWNVARNGTTLAMDMGLDIGATALSGALGLGTAATLGVGLLATAVPLAASAALDHFDDQYKKLTRQNNFELSNNSAQLLQRQLANLQGAGSNVAEMMHN